ncbi:electron transport complex subunit RsxB [Piscinibacter sp.]|uniref:electron transport complex subunit RsxB n=1 Tax=Piscinibacter sp. TaxID=1903157 RepID=UPI002590F0F8|nr:electron transport complex subunit RsxB [Piscinibacter sp.]
MTPEALADAIDAALPQTQCTRCGYPDCASYARAVTAGEAGINQCPPGGAEGIARLAALTGRAPLPLDPAHGAEGPLRLAVIDESWCIGCTLCIKACPVDCIVGAAKVMHTVIASQCTGCELCAPACPVDCIAMRETGDGRTGWDAWSPAQADQARERYAFHRVRVARDARENEARLAAKAEAKLADLPNQTRLSDPAAIEHKRRVIEEALARARARRAAVKEP